MGGKYEIRFFNKEAGPDDFYDFDTIHTNSWLEFMKIRLTRKVIYYTVRY